MIFRAQAEKWRAAWENLDKGDAKLALAVLDRALGKKDALSDYPKLEAAIEAVVVAKRKKRMLMKRLGSDRNRVRNRVLDRVDDRVYDRVLARVEGRVYDRVLNLIQVRVWDRVQVRVWSRVRARVEGGRDETSRK